MLNIVAFAGSARKGSFNQAILDVAVKGAQEAGAKVTVVDWSEFDMPLFNEDLEREQGIPDAAQRFKQLLIDADGFLVATPEHNSSYPALLKNAIDWASRQSGDEGIMAAYRGKVAGIMAASPGGLGGMRALVPLRMLLENLGLMVIPAQKAVGGVMKLMDDAGNISDEKTIKGLKKIGTDLTHTLSKLKA